MGTLEYNCVIHFSKPQFELFILPLILALVNDSQIYEGVVGVCNIVKQAINPCIYFLLSSFILIPKLYF